MTQMCDGQHNNAPERRFSLVQAGFWMSFCVSVSFAAVYLQALGYSNGRLGVIMALGSIMGIAASTTLSARIDGDERITAKKVIPWILALQTASLLILLLINARSFAVSVSFVAYIGFCTTVNALNLKLYADADLAGSHIDYGFTRGIGSLAYVLISVVLGLLTERVSPRALPAAGLMLCILQAAAFLMFARYVAEGKKADPFGERSSTLMDFLKYNPRYSLLLTGVVLLFFGHSTACSFLINLTRNVGGSAADMGFINAFKGLVEIPMLFLYARFFKDGKHSVALRIAAVSFELKLLAFILARNVWQLTAAFIFQAPSYALYMAAVVYYVKETIDHKDSAKAQSLAFTTTTLGGMLASLIGGQLYDHLSVTSTLWVALAAGAIGTVIIFLGTRERQIMEFFELNNKVAIAFSGGVDSTYLLYDAVKAGADVKAYCVKSAFQPGFEFEAARELAEQIGAQLEVIEVDVLSDEKVTANPPDRCYYCKQHIMSAIKAAAKADGYDVVCDGTNASDDADDRPGFRALGELGIRSPLRECGLTKEDIRRLSKEAGLPTWDKPAYACLATRIRTGEGITSDKLRITEEAESKLYDMGFRDFRVRMRGNSALVQIREDQHAEAMERKREISDALSGLYDAVAIDEMPRAL